MNLFLSSTPTLTLQPQLAHFPNAQLLDPAVEHAADSDLYHYSGAAMLAAKGCSGQVKESHMEMASQHRITDCKNKNIFGTNFANFGA